jgi:hypothetical protein
MPFKRHRRDFRHFATSGRFYPENAPVAFLVDFALCRNEERQFVGGTGLSKAATA